LGSGQELLFLKKRLPAGGSKKAFRIWGMGVKVIAPMPQNNRSFCCFFQEEALAYYLSNPPDYSKRPLAGTPGGRLLVFL
jgi:hypothetical protein